MYRTVIQRGLLPLLTASCVTLGALAAPAPAAPVTPAAAVTPAVAVAPAAPVIPTEPTAHTPYTAGLSPFAPPAPGPPPLPPLPVPPATNDGQPPPTSDDRAVRAMAGVAQPLHDLRPLRRMIGRATIVGMGEATHNSREFTRTKSRVFRELVRREGFTTFSLEANWSTGVRLNAYVLHGEGDPRQIMREEFQNAYFIWNTLGGGEYPFLLAITVAAIGFAGPGRWSLDAILLGVWPGWIGPAAVLLGVLAAIVPVTRAQRVLKADGPAQSRPPSTTTTSTTERGADE